MAQPRLTPPGNLPVRGPWLAALLAAAWGLSYTAGNSLAAFWSLAGPTRLVILATLFGIAVAGLGAWRRWAGWLAADLALVGALVAYLYLPQAKSFAGALVEQLIRFAEQVRVENNWLFEPVLGRTLLFLAVFLMAWAITLDLLRRPRPVWTLYGGAVYFGVLWAMYFEPAITWFLPFIALTLAAWGLGEAGRRAAAWQRDGRRVGLPARPYAALAAVSALTMVSSVLPSHFAPADLGEVALWFQERMPFLTELRGVGGYTDGTFTTGFAQDVGRLGGSVLLNHAAALTVDVGSAPKSGLIYLRGSVANRYTGRGWERDRDSSPLEADRSTTLPRDFSEAVWTDPISFSVTTVGLSTTNLFTALAPYSITLPGADAAKFRFDQLGNAYTRRALGRDQTYSVQAAVPLLNEAQLRAVTRGKQGPELNSSTDISQENITPRVMALASQITEGYDNPFDKAMALERYLRERYPYTLRVADVPEGADFVENFLFDGREGYCTYYSSAMVVMLRSQGIPARWVQGFVVPVTAGQTRYEVQNSQAHAWVEAKLPGFGWVTFDPTPRPGWARVAYDQVIPENRQPETQDPTADDAKENRLPTLDDLEDAEEAAKPDPEGTASPLGVGSSILSWALGLVLLAALGGWLFFRRWLPLEPGAVADGRLKVVRFFDHVARLMALFGQGRRPDQTSLEYGRQLSRDWPRLAEPLGQLTAGFQVARYGSAEDALSPETEGAADAVWVRAKEVVVDRYGWLTYLRRRLGLGIARLPWLRRRP